MCLHGSGDDNKVVTEPEANLPPSSGGRKELGILGGVFFCVYTEESPLDRKGQEGVGAQPLAGGNKSGILP